MVLRRWSINNEVATTSPRRVAKKIFQTNLTASRVCRYYTKEERERERREEISYSRDIEFLLATTIKYISSSGISIVCMCAFVCVCVCVSDISLCKSRELWSLTRPWE